MIDVDDNARDVMFGRESDEWGTPPELYNALDEIYHFDFDPCPMGCWIDGLAVDWGRSSFINPPYSKIPEWVERCYEEWQDGNVAIMLIPNRSETRWYHDYILDVAPLVYQVKGRISFYGRIKEPGQPKNTPKDQIKYTWGSGPAAFPSIIVCYAGESVGTTIFKPWEQKYPSYRKPLHYMPFVRR